MHVFLPAAAASSPADDWELPDECLMSLPDFSGNLTAIGIPAACSAGTAADTSADTSAAAVPAYAASLNAAQREAVLAPLDYPLQIVAGAGSGKTSVLTARIQHVLSSGVLPARVLAVTFTKAAAEEMRDRLQRAVGPKAAKEVTILTFHALSLALCRSYADHAGRPRDFKVWTTRQQTNAVRKALAELRVASAAAAAQQQNEAELAAPAPAPGAHDDEAAAAATKVSTTKSPADPARLLTSIMYAKARGQAAADVADSQLRSVYERYAALLLEANAFDMLDFLLVATAALVGSAEVMAARLKLTRRLVHSGWHRCAAHSASGASARALRWCSLQTCSLTARATSTLTAAGARRRAPQAHARACRVWRGLEPGISFVLPPA